MAAQGAPRVMMATATEARVAWPDLPPAPVAEPVYSPGSASRLTCWLHRDRVLAELCADLADSPHAIASADRPGLLRDLEGRIHALEICEEKLVMQALGQGLDVARRVNASPWAILFSPEPEQEALQAAE